MYAKTLLDGIGKKKNWRQLIMNSPEYIWENPGDSSFILNVYKVELGERCVYLAELVGSNIEGGEIAGFGKTVNDALWDMAESQYPVRNFAIHALYDRYTKNMGNWSEEDRTLLLIEHDHTISIEKFYHEKEEN